MHRFVKSPAEKVVLSAHSQVKLCPSFAPGKARNRLVPCKLGESRHAKPSLPSFKSRRLCVATTGADSEQDDRCFLRGRAFPVARADAAKPLKDLHKISCPVFAPMGSFLQFRTRPAACFPGGCRLAQQSQTGLSRASSFLCFRTRCHKNCFCVYSLDDIERLSNVHE